MQKVVVASTNPVKINTTKDGFKLMFPQQEFTFEGIATQSNVSDQPMSEQETITGAMNRADNAHIVTPDSDFWVGIEGGLKQTDGQLEAFAWIVIKSSNGVIGKGRTGSFFLPEKISELIRQGIELGEADDIVFNRQNSKQENGSVGILTHNIITRQTYYESAVIMALIPFVNPTLY